MNRLGSDADDFIEPSLLRAHGASVTIRWHFSINGKRCRPIQSTGLYVEWELAMEREGIPVKIDAGLIGLN